MDWGSGEAASIRALRVENTTATTVAATSAATLTIFMSVPVPSCSAVRVGGTCEAGNETGASLAPLDERSYWSLQGSVERELIRIVWQLGHIEAKNRGRFRTARSGARWNPWRRGLRDGCPAGASERC